jgi:hypothetical protein
MASQVQVTSTIYEASFRYGGVTLYDQTSSPSAGVIEVNRGNPAGDQGVNLQFQIDGAGDVDEIQEQFQVDGATTPVTHTYELVGGNTQETVTGAVDFSGATVTGLPGGSGWVLVDTISTADMVALGAVGSGDITSYTLAAKEGVERFLIRTKTVGTGPGLTVLTASIKIGTTAISPPGPTDGMVANDITCQGLPSNDTVAGYPSWTATTAVKVTVATNINLDQLTGGEFELYLKTDSIP